MYIRTVKIENYRAFKNFEIKLSPLSLIIGENEAGKTNLFDALALPLNSNDISFYKNVSRYRISTAKQSKTFTKLSSTARKMMRSRL